MSRKIIKACLLSFSAIIVLLWAITVKPASYIQSGNGMIMVSADDTTGTPTATATPGATETSGTPAATSTPTPTPTAGPATADVAETLVLYESEQISVRVKGAESKVYYAVLKNDSTKGVKLAELLPAAENTNGMIYYIDISTLSASKVNYIGITTLSTPGSDGLVPVDTVKVLPNQKKIVFNVNWAYEGTPREFTAINVLESVVISNNDSTTTEYKHFTSAETQTLKKIGGLSSVLQWRKGANGDWKAIDEMQYTDWTAMRSSGAILYFRLKAKNQDSKNEGNRFSKENKVKIAVSKAPSVKIDVSKLCVPIKNGMQFRQSGKTDWCTVLPFSAKSTNNTAMSTTAFDPFTQSTSVKVAATSISDIKKAISYVAPANTSGAAITIDVRTGATTKKPASRVGMLSIPVQGPAPAVAGLTKTGENYTIGNITPRDTLVASPAYEMCVVMKTDIDNGLVDFTSLSWSTVKAGTVLKSNIKTTYLRLDAAKTRITSKITDSTAVILIRRRGVAGSAKADPVLASEPAIVTIPTN